MANLCDTKLRCRSENGATLEAIETYLETHYDDYCSVERNGEDFMSIDLISDWAFPIAEMEDMTSAVPADDTLTIVAVSFDTSIEYVAHHLFENGKWRREYANITTPEGYYGDKPTP